MRRARGRNFRAESPAAARILLIIPRKSKWHFGYTFQNGHKWRQKKSRLAAEIGRGKKTRANPDYLAARASLIPPGYAP